MKHVKALTVATTAVLVVSVPVDAHAEKTGHGKVGQVKTQGDAGNGKVSATVAGVLFDYSKNPRSDAAGPVTPQSGWEPPACWYAPKWTAEDGARDRLGLDFSPNHDQDNADSLKSKYIDGSPYKNFNVRKQGKGYWWASFKDSNRLDDPATDECTKLPFWVDTGDRPPADAKNAVTPEILAQLAYAQIRIPQGRARTSDGTSTVNVPNWIWLDRTTFHPVSVRAYVSVLGISATTTATPVSLHIDPGTQDATLFPASGDCSIDAKGNIGTPYAKGDAGAPPCGVTYLRSTQNIGPYQLKATVTWKISWTGTGQPTPVALPDGTFGTPQDAYVREVQTVNR